MRSQQLTTCILFCFAIFLAACQGDSDQIREQARQNLPQANPATTTPAAPATPSFTTGEAHYKCPNNCAGGTGAAQGNCPVCGTAMAHNAAYHNSAVPTTPTTPSVNAPQTITPSSTSPAQNTAGVYHYTCTNGCAGGAGSAGTCATCGSALVHNTAYHGN